MHAFDYAVPQSVDEAISMLSSNGGSSRVLAGGTDLIPQLKEGRRQIKLMVDIKKIPDTTALSYDAQEGLHLGAAVPCCAVYEFDAVKENYPALVDSTSLIGSIQIQSRASVGGNLCNSSPAADTIPSLIVLGAICQIAGPNGRREAPAESFCTGPGQNVMASGEFLVGLKIPAPEPNSGSFFNRFIPRNEMDIAVVNAAALVVLEDDKKSIRSARVAVGAVAPTPLYLEAIGELLAGKEVSDELIEEAADIARKAARPISDMRGTVEQRRHLAGVLTRRALKGAIERAKES